MTCCCNDLWLSFHFICSLHTQDTYPGCRVQRFGQWFAPNEDSREGQFELNVYVMPVLQANWLLGCVSVAATQNAIVQVDATPFKLFYIKHYGLSKDFFNQTKVIFKLILLRRMLNLIDLAHSHRIGSRKQLVGCAFLPTKSTCRATQNLTTRSDQGSRSARSKQPAKVPCKYSSTCFCLSELCAVV